MPLRMPKPPRSPRSLKLQKHPRQQDHSGHHTHIPPPTMERKQWIFFLKALFDSTYCTIQSSELLQTAGADTQACSRSRTTSPCPISCHPEPQIPAWLHPAHHKSAVSRRWTLSTSQQGPAPGTNPAPPAVLGTWGCSSRTGPQSQLRLHQLHHVFLHFLTRKRVEMLP